MTKEAILKYYIIFLEMEIFSNLFKNKNIPSTKVGQAVQLFFLDPDLKK
jgi:hypothetical protein